MNTLSLTNIYLETAQKKALARKAKTNGTNLSTEIRSAVDAYLAGISVDELKLLDAATERAGAEIAEMNRVLDKANGRAVRFFREIEKIKAAAK